MARSPDFFLPWPPLAMAVEKVAALPEGAFAKLLDEVQGEQGLTRDLPRLERLARELDGLLEVHEVFSVLASLDYLYGRARDWRKEGESDASEIEEFLKVTGLLQRAGGQAEQVVQRLVALVAPNVTADRQRKLHWLRTGMLPTAVAFSSFLDLRPSFDADRSRIDDVVPAVLLRVATETQYGDDEAFVVQLSEASLTSLKVVLEDIERKLALVKQFDVFNTGRSEDDDA